MPSPRLVFLYIFNIYITFRSNMNISTFIKLSAFHNPGVYYNKIYTKFSSLMIDYVNSLTLFIMYFNILITN